MFAPRKSRNRKAPSAWPVMLGMLALPIMVLVSFGPGRERLVRPDMSATSVAVAIHSDHLQMSDSVPAGMVEFVVTNNDSVAHGLAVRAAGAEKPTAKLDSPVGPGAKAKTQVTLDAGSYDVYCPDGSKKLAHRLTVLTRPTLLNPDR